jgi:nucleoid-associated protein YgaU
MATQADVAQVLQGTGVQVFGLRVEDAGGTTAVYGTVASEQERQRAVRAIESATGAKIVDHLEVQVPIPGAAPATQPQQQQGQVYTVKSGDTLRKIAQRFYGDEMKWHAIRDANRDKLPNPDRIQVGLQLVIPEQP